MSVCLALQTRTLHRAPSMQVDALTLAAYQCCLSISGQVLCTTSTLAMGINLPAHLVVLKGTRRWTSNPGEAAGYKEYDRSECLQMVGRAGRPQFDTEGVAVIMTEKQVELTPHQDHRHYPSTSALLICLNVLKHAFTFTHRMP